MAKEMRETVVLRNWIEKAIGKQWAWAPSRIGRVDGGREVYNILWTDGTSADYFINYDEHTIREVDWANRGVTWCRRRR